MLTDTPIITYTREAMAGEFHVELLSSAAGGMAAIAALDEVTRLESLLSVFRPDSLASRINAIAASEPVAVPGNIWQLLTTARLLSEATGGAFDVTSYPLTQLWSRAKHSSAIPTPEDIAAAQQCVGFEHVTLDETARTILFDQTGVAISFGAIGKGFALDAAANILRQSGVSDFLLHGGMSSVLAEGTWRIGVAHSARPQQRLGELLLTNRALATSGTQKQFFRHGGKRWGHIIDPVRGTPADAGVIGVTVLAETAAEADALSTAFFVMGRERIATFIAEKSNSAQRVVPVALVTFAANNATGYEVVAFDSRGNEQPYESFFES